MDVTINSSSPMYHVPEGTSIKEADSGAAKIYLLLLTYDVSEDDGDFNQKWEFIKGREAVYNHLKDLIIDSFETNHPLIIEESFIAVDTMKMKITDSKPIHKFMKDVIARGQIIDKSGFNIDDYISIESPESNESDPEEVRYGQGEQNIPYDQTNAVDGGEV